MTSSKPIKRNAAIAALSKDHHFALLLLWKIREGLKKNIATDRIIRYVIHFYENDLIGHFKDEEEFLFVKLAPLNPLRIQAETEHTQIHQLIGELKKNPGSTHLLKKFSVILEKHIRFEERVLFNLLQEIIPAEELTAIADQLNSRESKSGVLWTDPFWSK